MALPFENALHEYDDVSIQKGQNAKAYLLIKNHQYSAKQLTVTKFASSPGILRAERALENGFEACRPGRHQKLNDHDESVLESWILQLLDEGEVIHTCRVMQMVCFENCLYYHNNL